MMTIKDDGICFQPSYEEVVRECERLRALNRMLYDALHHTSMCRDVVVEQVLEHLAIRHKYVAPQCAYFDPTFIAPDIQEAVSELLGP